MLLKGKMSKKVYLIQFVTKFINLHNTVVAADVVNKRLFTTYIYQKNILSGLNRHSASTTRKTVRWIAQSMCSLNLQIQNSINLLCIYIAVPVWQHIFAQYVRAIFQIIPLGWTSCFDTIWSLRKCDFHTIYFEKQNIKCIH